MLIIEVLIYLQNTKKCDFLCLDIPELRLATGDRYSSIEFLASKIKNR